jgi:hypothetical protein
MVATSAGQPAGHPVDDLGEDTVPPATDGPPRPPVVEVSALTRLLDGTHADVRYRCRRVRPIAVELVDAFGVPPGVLRARDLVG